MKQWNVNWEIKQVNEITLVTRVAGAKMTFFECVYLCYRWPLNLTRACPLRSPARAATAKWFTSISEDTFSFRRAQKTRMKH